MDFSDIQQQATIDLARFIAPNHFDHRGHKPEAYREIADSLIWNRMGLTRRELAAAKALAAWVTYEIEERKIFDSVVTGFGEEPKHITDNQSLRVDALLHLARKAAHNYAEHVDDPLLMRQWPMPVWKYCTSEPQAAPTPLKPVTRSAAQDDAILEALRGAGHNPKELPKNNPGRPGAKAAARLSLVGKHPVFPTKGEQFDKAWDRLRSLGDIVDAM